MIYEFTTPDGLLVDSASGNTWIGADQEYTITSTSTSTGDAVVCIYSFVLSFNTDVSLQGCLLRFRQFFWARVPRHYHAELIEHQ